MTKKLASHLHRNRHGIFYFRRAVPSDLRQFFGTREIYRSLQTGSMSDAKRLVRLVAAKAELAFYRLRQGMAKQGGIGAGLITEFDIDELTGKTKIKVTKEPHDSIEDYNSALSHAAGLMYTAAPCVRLPVASHARSLSELITSYMSEQKAVLSPESVLDYEGDLRQMQLILGDVPITDLTHERMNACKETLVKLPPNINKDPALRGLTIPEILALNRKPQSGVTARKKWGRFESFLNWADAHGHISTNTATGKRPKAKASSYQKYTEQDLKMLFETPCFAAASEPFQYWLPILGLYTGARIEELAALTLSDIKQNADTGIWGIEITREIDGEEKPNGKRIKNDNSIRACPLHSEVLKLGFLDYVLRLRLRGNTRLFPELAVDQYGKCGARASEWFTSYRRSRRVGDLEGRSKKVFHSFRHTMISTLQKAGVAQEMRESLAGHTSRSITVRVYGSAPELAAMHEAIERLNYGIAIPNAGGNWANR